MTIEEMKNRKRELGYTNRTIAEKAQLPLSTVQKIFSGATLSPREETIRALERLLSPSRTYQSLPDSGPGMVCEAQPAYAPAEKESSGEAFRPESGKQKRLYTLEDYLALPEDVRAELIDGVFYVMCTPTTVHQGIAGFIYKKLLDHVLDHKGPCFPFIAPLAVQLDSDDRTVVEPDVLVVCDRSKYQNGRVFGAPDLVIEVLSPSTRKKDMGLKYYKYGRAGVREYWIIDPEKKKVVQYDLLNSAIPVVYDFDGKVPVLIWEGSCVIDLKEMNDVLSFLWE